jgi:hypothetical protein
MIGCRSVDAFEKIDVFRDLPISEIPSASHIPNNLARGYLEAASNRNWFVGSHPEDIQEMIFKWFFTLLKVLSESDVCAMTNFESDSSKNCVLRT